MKILFVLPEYLPQTGGGITTFYAALLPTLAAAGHEVRVLYGSSVTSAPGGGKSTIDGIETEILDTHLVTKYLPLFARYQIVPKLQQTLAAAWALWEQAQQRPDIDVVETTDWGLLFVPWILRQGPPVVASLHGSMGQIARHDPLDGEQVADALIEIIEIQGLATVEGVKSSSTSNARFWEQQLDRRVHVVPLVWRARTLPARGGDRTTRGLVVARVQHWKGPQVLCEALHLLGDRAPAIDWIGRDVPIHHQGGSTSQYLAKTWPEIWGSRIRHLPGENPVQIHARQRSAGFVVVPSIWDVFNFACVEAMEAATPVVCSSGAGASELIEAGVSGFVAEPGNARSLADEIDRLLSLGPRARQAIGEAGADVISRTLSPEAVLPAQLDFYRSVAGRAERPRTPSEWFAATCEPASMVPSLDAALGQLPLRRLIQHSLGRIKDRLSLPRAHR